MRTLRKKYAHHTHLNGFRLPNNYPMVMNFICWRIGEYYHALNPLNLFNADIIDG
ncbi:MAG: hypothetical protein PUP46_03865 [Endozoicomonas sp. (ex Botrylloides leachii)]|nr:hypothetical protein [Endozoicomonas sp. (ex Botrylloides leachii)]